MKLFKYGMPLAALALLASCSNDNLDGPEVGGTEYDGSGLYLNVNLAMPYDGTRAETTVGFGNGDANEYAVKDGKLYLYTTDGAYIGVVNLNKESEETGTEGANITKTLNYNEIQMPSTVVKGETETDVACYALVILNTEQISLPTAGQTFTQWAEHNQPSVFHNDEYFAMTNALGWAGEVEGNNKPAVLTPITNGQLYYKTEKPEGYNAVKIFVQRVVAKVTVKGGEYMAETPKALGEGEGVAKVKLEGWWLDYTNDSAYPVQNLGTWATTVPSSGAALVTSWSSAIDGTQLKRFFGKNNDFTRVYWCEDPNYEPESTDDANITHITTAPSGASLLGNNASDYCNENTFSLANMMQDQSTRVVFKGTYYVDGTDVAKDFISFDGVAVAVTNWKETLPVSSASGQKLSDLVDETKDEGAELAALCSLFNINKDDAKVNYHKGGEVYYYAIIRHFENDQLFGEDKDWELKYDNYVSIPSSETIKGDLYLLGRYGVVRNNWYEVIVSKVSGPGEPVPPTPTPNTPDDPKAKLMLDAKVNILSWAKRSHDYDL